ncbi:RagB/SusD family nutrient uptake outer membrane protein [Sphingobacterium sp. HJSM2_6]|uniref:RagB/SusD family nutrient uptake outer membrane protein n=1 Tax=Sphingobacterium sp. HJSM2_6 TaxID=3366264 RepID=UPI003BC91960
MKKYYKIGVLFLVSLSFSCSKLMDAPKDDRINLDDVFRSKNMLQNYLGHIYWYMGTNGSEGGFLYDNNKTMLASFSDEAVDARNFEPNSKISMWYDGKNTQESFGFNNELLNWNNFYAAIRRCNTVISYLEDPNYNISIAQFDDGYRNYYLAQCYIIRAFNYLELIKRYGGVPIVNERLEITFDFSNYRKASFAQNVDQILSDCNKGLELGSQKAQPLLPWIYGAGLSRMDMTAAIAWMIKSEAVTFAASPLWVDNHAGTEKYTWDRALAVTNEALEQCLENGYALQNFAGADINATANNLVNYFLTAPDFTGTIDKETIHIVLNNDNDIQRVRTKVWQFSGVPVSGQLSAGSCPTQELVDSYEITNGVQAQPILNLANPYIADSHVPNFNPKALELGYVDNGNRMYLNRDPRFYATIYYNGSNRGGMTVNTFLGGSHQISADPSNIRNTRTGYYLKKYSNPESTVSNNLDGYFRFYRLSNLYLNYVEALNNVYGPTGSLTNSAVPEKNALDALNKLRSTRGMPAVAATEVADQATFELRYKNERRVELAFEGKRFFDVRRWQTPDGSLSETEKILSGIEINSNQTVNTRKPLRERMSHSNKYLMFPIPYDEVQKVNRLTGENWQNQGW